MNDPFQRTEPHCHTQMQSWWRACGWPQLSLMLCHIQLQRIFQSMAILFPRYGKGMRILKKRAREMSRSDKVSRTFELLHILRTAKKSQGAAEKNKEKVEVNCTGFSAEFFGSQSAEMFCFARKTKIQILTTSCRSVTFLGLYFLKSLRPYDLPTSSCQHSKWTTS